MLARAGNTADDLQCGTHRADAVRDCAARCRRRRRIRRSRTTARASTAACSRTAPHAATTRHDYLAFDHPLQQEIRRAVARIRRRCRRRRWSPGSTAARRPTTRCRSRDSRLAFRATRRRRRRRGATAARRGTLADAMTAHPEMVSGERRSDLALARAGRGDWVCKIGAEGVQAIGHHAAAAGGSRSRSPTATRRGLHPATVAALDQLGLLDADGRRAAGAVGGADAAQLPGYVHRGGAQASLSWTK